MNTMPQRDEYREDREPKKIGRLELLKHKGQDMIDSLVRGIDSLIRGQNESECTSKELTESCLSAMEPMETEEGKLKKNEAIERIHKENCESAKRRHMETMGVVKYIIYGTVLVCLERLKSRNDKNGKSDRLKTWQ